MDFDPNAMNFGAAQKLSPRAEPGHVAVLSRQAKCVSQDPEQAPVAKRLEVNLQQHQRQARVERLKQMQQALATHSNAQRLMQALALVKKVYTADDAPSDLATMGLLQPILQGLWPKWKQLKAEKPFAIAPRDYQVLQKLKQAHAGLPTAERAALFKLLYTVYKAIDAEAPQAPVVPSPARLMALKSQWLRATSDIEKQRIQAEIQQVEIARQRDYHGQCMRVLREHYLSMPEMPKYPPARLLQQLSQLEQQWQKNRYAEAHHPVVPTLLQLSSRQLARLGVADASDFIRAQRKSVQQHLNALYTPEIRTLLQNWCQGFEGLLQSFQEGAETRRLQATREERKELQERAARWPTHVSEIEALEQQFLAATAETKTALRKQLLQHYGQLLSTLPPITSSGENP